MTLASVQQNIAIVTGVVLTLGWLLYLFFNTRRARAEIGSELELAPNRKPYLSDEELEGPKLEKTLTWGLLSLVVIGVGLPVYWLAEPGRQEGAAGAFVEEAAARGEHLFEPTADGGFNCAGCHGGLQAVGQEVPYTIEDPPGSGTLRQVQWKAPSLNDVLLRMSEEQVKFVITYGRPFSPMPAWGLAGGGAMNEQQINDLYEYLKTIQISPEEAKKKATDEYGTDGEALFEAYCARCHTRGWSYGEPETPGNGALGPSLTGGAAVRQFPVLEGHTEFVANGACDRGTATGCSATGKLYGANGTYTGRMPFFGNLLSNEQIESILRYEREEL